MQLVRLTGMQMSTCCTNAASTYPATCSNKVTGDRSLSVRAGDSCDISESKCWWLDMGVSSRCGRVQEYDKNLTLCKYKQLDAMTTNEREDSRVHAICGNEHTLILLHLLWYGAYISDEFYIQMPTLPPPSFILAARKLVCWQVKF